MVKKKSTYAKATADNPSFAEAPEGKPSFAGQLRQSGYEDLKASEGKSSFAKASEDNPAFAKASEGKGKKGLKVECCEKYLKKGEHKRCKRCPCFDMAEAERLQRFKHLEIEIKSKG